MRLRFCYFGLKYDRTITLPSGSYLQVATTCARIPTNLWRCTCNVAGKPAQPTEHVLDWYGQGAQKAEWRNKTRAIMAASVHTRVDKGARTYVQSPKNGPGLDHVVRRVTMSLGDNAIMQDMEIQDQLI
eukprot:8277749-Pyramimonas_sp.AAC.1